MNLIQRQAIDFTETYLNSYGKYKDFIEAVKTHLWDYRKVSYKVEFLKTIIQQVKIEYDNHLLKCNATVKSECPTNQFYENTLFFLQQELDELDGELSTNDFNFSERNHINQALQQIIDDLNKLKHGQEITYNDFAQEFEELKDLYFLNKKHWVEILTGKLTEMVAGGVISETLSKEIVNSIRVHYPNLIGS